MINLRTILIILVVLIIGSGAFLLYQVVGGNLKLAKKTTQTSTNAPVTLQFWGVFDDISAFQPTIDAYQTRHPNVKIVYTRKEASLYEFASLNLLASQEGPDVWVIPSSWLAKHQDKFGLAPEGLLAAQNLPPSKKSLFGKAAPTPTNASLYAKLFAPVTAQNNLTDQGFYTVPLSVDTLGLFANAHLLQAASITRLPSTWDDVVVNVKQLAKRNNATLEKPAINLGTSHNVTQAPEILATLMIQNHTPMVSADKSPSKVEALYNQAITKATGEPIVPGAEALDFYTSFASPTKENFSWSADMPSDFELFAAGGLPLLIDYSYRVNDIKQKSPTLSFSTGPLPQVSLTDPAITLGTSQMVGVTAVSRQPNQAWNFISFLTNEANSAAYSHAAGRPPARLNLANDPQSDPALRPFMAQTPFATTWYRNEINKTDLAFKQAIDAILAGQTVADVANKLTKQVTHILRSEPYE